MLLATYGTFRSGEALSIYLDHLREHGSSEVMEITGLKLFVVGLAPGAKVTNDPNDKAVIELIEADISDEETKDTLKDLDRAEGVAHGLYERNSIDTPRGKALIYTKCGDLNECVTITDWMEWQKKGEAEKQKAMSKAGKLAIYV